MSAPATHSKPLGVPASEAAPPGAIPELHVTGQSLGARMSTGRVLVAVTGGPDTAAPTAVAHALERRYGTTVSAIQVLDVSGAALPAPLPSAFTLARELIGDAPYEAEARTRREQFGELLGERNQWPVHIAVGTPATEILRHADATGAALIVMGLRHHGTLDRVLRDETTLHVARRAHAPVLAVVSDLRGLPRRAVVGVDFGPASVQAARAALDMLARPVTPRSALLRLVYVNRWDGDTTSAAATGEALIRRLGADAAFTQLIRELEVPPNVRVDTTTLYGDPATELLAFATESEADLIAVGSLRHERIEQWMVGSVTTEIIRDGRCSVLVIPPARRSG
ncbi:MAG TPA: universal stress protein [Gemmatimonadaceae bacterium]|nr:universal stress protein [Gemmatimonadaceae bacterium]